MGKILVAWIRVLGAGADYAAAMIEYRRAMREYKKVCAEQPPVDVESKGRPKLHLVKD